MDRVSDEAPADYLLLCIDAGGVVVIARLYQRINIWP